MALDMKALMQDPNMLAAMNSFAQTGFQPGATAGSRFGKAGLNTARDLQRIETASGNRTWRSKQSAIQEERNRIMQEMNQKKFELMQKQHSDEQSRFAGGPKTVGDKNKPDGYTYGGRFYQKPRMSFEDMMMMNMMGGMGGMPLDLAGGDNNDPYTAALGNWQQPAATPPPARQAPTVPTAVAPQRQVQGFNRAHGIIPGLTGELTPQQQLAIERMKLMGGQGIQLAPSATPINLP